MYQKFTVTTVDIDKIQKLLHINFSFDVDEDTITNQSVYVTDEKGDVINTKLSVEGTKLILSFTGNIKLNTPYFLVITKDVLSALGTNIYHAVKHEFQFKTECRSLVKILSPAEFEEMKDTIHLEWKESAQKRADLCNHFRIQISDTHLFENILAESEVHDKTSVDIIDIKESKQYYVRIRAEKNQDDFGMWSAPVTFTLTRSNAAVNNPFMDEEEEPIYERPLEVLTLPEQGETPASFVFEFDGELDPKTIEENIVILQRTI